MKRTINRRERLLRVRHVQHAQAVAETARARDEAEAIANNAQRLARVRAELFKSEGVALGGSFAAYRELAGRLEMAGRQLDGALYDAKRKVEQKELTARSADREREIAERLKKRAYEAFSELQEARIAALPRYRRFARKEEA